MTLAFVSSPLDRANHLRSAEAELGQIRARPDCNLVRVRGDMVEVENDRPKLKGHAPQNDSIFLGLDSTGAPWFSANAPETAALAPLRGLMLAGTLPADMLSILAQARSLAHWHERHGFCANCGGPTEMADAGYRRHCANCKADHFPRTDPVVIIAVKSDKGILLGRQASWPEGMYSALAGFAEPGETIEQAARREVFEESGIRVGKISYIQSQPWPFPSSLMIGLVGQAETTEITIDQTELQDARWFSMAETKLMLRRKHAQGFTASHPYAIAHHLVKAALLARFPA